MIKLEDIIQDFVEVNKYYRSLPERYFPEDDYSDDILYERIETIQLLENPE